MAVSRPRLFRGERGRRIAVRAIEYRPRAGVGTRTDDPRRPYRCLTPRPLTIQPSRLPFHAHCVVTPMKDVSIAFVPHGPREDEPKILRGVAQKHRSGRILRRLDRVYRPEAYDLQSAKIHLSARNPALPP